MTARIELRSPSGTAQTESQKRRRFHVSEQLLQLAILRHFTLSDIVLYTTTSLYIGYSTLAAFLFSCAGMSWLVFYLWSHEPGESQAVHVRRVSSGQHFGQKYLARPFSTFPCQLRFVVPGGYPICIWRLHKVVVAAISIVLVRMRVTVDLVLEYFVHGWACGVVHR